ncbi:hypothetical protein LPB41_27555 [Thalassospira sp. MA62]|nr:hypothetical protein [Thalassospira sp. MA62]
MPQSQPAAVALMPLNGNTGSADSAPTAPTQSTGAAGGAQPQPVQTPDIVAQSATPATPINSAAAVVTVIQQLDPRDIDDAPPADEDAGQSPGSRQQEARENTPEQARQPTSNPALLTASEQEIVRELQARDATVRTEEESHQTLAGANAGMISYSYTAGPDGRLYATGGKVSIRPIQGLDGMAAIANQAAISRAASVPGSSGADFNVAKGASMSISAMISAQAFAAAESYRATLGLNAAPSTVDLSG